MRWGSTITHECEVFDTKHLGEGKKGIFLKEGEKETWSGQEERRGQTKRKRKRERER